MKTLCTYLSITMLVFLTACSHNSPRYAASANNQEKLRSFASENPAKKLGVESFTATEAGKKSIVCRAAGTVAVPDGKTFEQYLEDSLTSELKMSNLYSSTAPKLKGVLQSIDFNSNIGAGKWIIKMQLSCDNSNSFTVESQYDFSTNFVADIACEQVAQALPAATQDFIAKVLEAPGFKSCI